MKPTYTIALSLLSGAIFLSVSEWGAFAGETPLVSQSDAGCNMDDRDFGVASGLKKGTVKPRALVDNLLKLDGDPLDPQAALADLSKMSASTAEQEKYEQEQPNLLGVIAEVQKMLNKAYAQYAPDGTGTPTWQAFFKHPTYQRFQSSVLRHRADRRSRRLRRLLVGGCEEYL